MGVVWGVLRLWSYPSPYPDESLRFLVEHTGTWPRLSAQAPLWSGLGHWIASLDAGAMQSRMQMIGQATLAVSVGLFYRILVRFISLFLDQDEATPWRPTLIRLAGIGGAIFLMCCPPVWRAAQSPHPAIFGLFLTILATEFLLRYAEQRILLYFLLWAALTGIGLVESPLVLLVLPASIALLLFLPPVNLNDSDDDTEDGITLPSLSQWLVGGTLLVVLTTVCILYAVNAFNTNEGASLYGFSRRLQILIFFGVDYLTSLQGALPVIGWLIIFGGILLPWLLTSLLAWRVQNGDFGLSLRLVYAIAGAIALAQISTIESLQLWSLLPSVTFRVGACLFSAMTFALVVAAWLLGAERASRIAHQEPGAHGDPFSALVIEIIYLVVGGCMLGAVGHSIFQRREVAERVALRVFRDYTSVVVADAAGCDWVVTDGVFDHALRLEAWRTGSPLKPLCILSTQPSWVLHAIERRLPDPESRTLFSIGPQVMLREWLAARPEQARQVAAQLGYDLWTGNTITLLPQRTLFRSVQTKSAPTVLDSLMARHRPFWHTLETQLTATQPVTDPTLTFTLTSVRNNIARVANEVGVFAQDETQNDLAREAYSAARRINADNISALLNLWVLSHGSDGTQPSRPQELPDEIKRLSMLLGKSSVLGVIRLHGTIRTSQALAVLAAGQLMGGGQHEALARIDAALRLLPKNSSKTQTLQATAANLRWLNGDTVNARESYLTILKKTPTDINALLGLAVLEAAEGGLDAAIPLIDKARKAGAAPLLCDQLHATLCLEANAPAAARVILQPYVTQHTRSTAIWYLWGWALLSLQDLPGYEQAQAELRLLPNSRGLAESLASKAALQGGDLSTALLHAKAALSETPDNLGMLETVLRLCTTLGDYETAEPYAKSLLAIDSGHALARYALGSKLLLDGDATAAEPLLARSASTAPRPETLNNLACAQLQLNKLNEASVTAKAAVELAPERAEIWDTVAAVALAQGLPQEAETAARQALLLNPNAPAAWLRVAEAVAAKGNLSEAQSCLNRGNLNTPQALPPDVRSRLYRIKSLL